MFSPQTFCLVWARLISLNNDLLNMTRHGKFRNMMHSDWLITRLVSLPP